MRTYHEHYYVNIDTGEVLTERPEDIKILKTDYETKGDNITHKIVQHYHKFKENEKQEKLF